MVNSWESDFSAESLISGAEALESAGRFLQAGDLYIAAVEQHPSVATLAAHAGFLREREQFGASIARLTQLLDMATETGDDVAMGWAYEQLAGIYRDLGDFELAGRFQRRAIAAKPWSDHVDLTHLASDAVACGEFDVAETLAVNGLQMQSSGLESPVDLAADFGMLGVIRGLQGDRHEAIALLWQAYQLHQAANDAHGMGRDLMNLSEFFGDLGRQRTELRCLNRAVALLEAADLPRSLEQARACRAAVVRRNGAQHAV